MPAIVGGVLSGLLIVCGIPAGLIYLSRRHTRRQRAKAAKMDARLEKIGNGIYDGMMALLGKKATAPQYQQEMQPYQQPPPPMGTPVQPPMGIPVV